MCAPLRVCIIELQSGEKLAGEPHIGDSVRWNISPAMFGHGDSATTLIVLKPQLAGLDTNLLITTDRRAYYFRLLSKPDDYVARVAFSYPDDEAEKWQRQIATQKQQDQNSTIAALSKTAVDSLCFDYRVKTKAESIKPLRVLDDGQKTFIQISHEAQTREAPALVVIGSDGKQEMVRRELVKRRSCCPDLAENLGSKASGDPRLFRSFQDRGRNGGLTCCQSGSRSPNWSS